MPRKVHFEIPKSRREVGVFQTDAMTVEATSVGARAANEVSEDTLTIVRINPEDIPEFIRWARSLYKEWLKTQPKQSKGNTKIRRIDLDDEEEDDLDDAL
jgi:hypothetical protein